MKLYIGFILGILNFYAFAQDSTGDCQQEGFTFKNNAIIFNHDKATHRIFLIQNTSLDNLMLNHTKEEIGASAGWTSKLDIHQWSVLAMNQSHFSLSCEIFNPPIYKIIDCQHVLNICTYPAKNNVGSFWIIENTDLTNMLKTLKQRNVVN